MLPGECSGHFFNTSKELIVVSPHHTSTDCSACEHRGLAKPLHVREWVCTICGSHHDRDTNAAINVLNRGLARTA